MKEHGPAFKTGITRPLYANVMPFTTPEARDVAVTGQQKLLIVDHGPDMLALFQAGLSDLGNETAAVLASA